MIRLLMHWINLRICGRQREREHMFLLGIKEVLVREFHQKPEDAERLALLAVQKFPLVRWNDYEPALNHAVALTAVNDETKGEGNAARDPS